MPVERVTRKLVWGLVLATVLGGGIAIATYYYTSGPIGVSPSRGPHWGEDALITGVNFDAENPKTLLVGVKWLDVTINDNYGRNIVFVRASVVKASTGNDVSLVELDNVSLPPDTETTLSVAMRDSLPAGEYRVRLETARSGTFYSDLFTQP